MASSLPIRARQVMERAKVLRAFPLRLNSINSFSLQSIKVISFRDYLFYTGTPWRERIAPSTIIFKFNKF